MYCVSRFNLGGSELCLGGLSPPSPPWRRGWPAPRKINNKHRVPELSEACLVELRSMSLTKQGLVQRVSWERETVEHGFWNTCCAATTPFGAAGETWKRGSFWLLGETCLKNLIAKPETGIDFLSLPSIECKTITRYCGRLASQKARCLDKAPYTIFCKIR